MKLNFYKYHNFNHNLCNIIINSNSGKEPGYALSTANQCGSALDGEGIALRAEAGDDAVGAQ